METETEPRRQTSECVHCRANPKATKPFVKMKRLPMEDNVCQDIKETAKLHNEPPECFVCDLMHDALNALEQKYKD
jgi:hypothetical protein